MATKTYSGQLTLLGAGSTNSDRSNYSVIQIGDEAIRNVNCSHYLENYLKVGEEMQLEIRFGVKNISLPTTFLLFLFGILLGATLVGIPLAVIVFYFVYRPTIVKSITVNGKKYS